MARSGGSAGYLAPPGWRRPRAALEYRNGDADVVAKKLREHRIRPPDLP